MIASMLLCGCSKSARYTEKFEEFRAEILEREAIEILADVEVNNDENVCDYKILYKYNATESTVEVIEPEQISKVKAHIDDGETALEFDGVVLDVGDSVTSRLSPLTALPTLFEAICEGFIQCAYTEEVSGEELIVTEILMPDDTFVSVWQSKGDMLPRFATQQKDEDVAVKIQIINFN